jgi:uncharacterized membrane protein YcfT
MKRTILDMKNTIANQSKGVKAIMVIVLISSIIAIYKFGYTFGQWLYELLN